MPLVSVNGELVAEDEARISVFDHGLVVGDGVFETILLRRGAPFALTRHLDRIERSAAGLGIGPIDRAALARAVDAVVDTAAFDLGRIRVTVTAGRGPLGSGRLVSPPTVVVACAAESPVDHPSKAALVPWTRNEHGALAGLKTTSYAENALALAHAAERGADEAVFANTTGMLCEGTGTNVFVVRDGRLLTPPLSSGCLAGVTRSLVLERIGGEEVDIPISDLYSEAVSEVFLTSTLRGVQGVADFDGRALPAPGEITAATEEKYRALLEEIDP